MAYAVVAQYRSTPGHEHTVREALLAAREATRTEPANQAYEVHAVVEEPGTFLLYERYDDAEGFEAHKQAPHFREQIIERVWPLLADRSVTFAEVL